MTGVHNVYDGIKCLKVFPCPNSSLVPLQTIYSQTQPPVLIIIPRGHDFEKKKKKKPFQVIVITIQLNPQQLKGVNIVCTNRPAFVENYEIEHKLDVFKNKGR